MTKLSWAAISRNEDQIKNFQDILAFCMTLETNVELRRDISEVLLASAFDVLDQDGLIDGRTINLEESETIQKDLRLSNFLDYLEEFCLKRMALLQERDTYIAAKASLYKEISGSVQLYQVAQSAQRPHDDLRSDGADQKLSDREFQSVLQIFSDFRDGLLMKGADRLSLAKSLIDAAFLYALMSGIEFYAFFCSHVLKGVTGESDLDEQGLDEILNWSSMANAESSASIH